jgi:ABC-type amino acid transport substrate-binding protein
LRPVILKQKKILRGGTDAENPPFTYLENSEFKGIDIDICEKIADKWGATANYQYEFDDLFSALAQYKLILPHHHNNYEKRKQTFEFSEPYFQNICCSSKKSLSN